ncbi:hypothetical protein T4C_7103, partial [Trichinella pseudospiralis]
NDLTVKSVSDTPIEARSGREPGIAVQEKFTFELWKSHESAKRPFDHVHADITVA